VRIAFGFEVLLRNCLAITLSPRLSSDESEPVYSPEVNAALVSDPNAPNSIDTANGGQMIFSVMCRNCTGWSEPSLDLSSSTAPFMFALGPINDGSSNYRWSDSPSNPLRIHIIHGIFDMNMQLATVPLGEDLEVPSLGNESYGAASNPKVLVESDDFVTMTHAITMALAFAVVFPLNALLWEVVRLFWIHIVIHIFVIVLWIAGLFFGCWASIEYIRVSTHHAELLRCTLFKLQSCILNCFRLHITRQSKNFSSAHQIIGFIIIVLYLIQLPVGYVWHRRSSRGETPRTLRVSYIVITSLVFIFAVVAGALGFRLALDSKYYKVWIPLGVGVLAIYLLTVGVYHSWYKAKTKGETVLRPEQDIMPIDGPPIQNKY